MTVKELCLRLVELREQNKITNETEIYFLTYEDNTTANSEEIFELVTEITIDEENDIILS